jgi:hypothetical protein
MGLLAWLQRVLRGSAPEVEASPLPPGWTDDLTIALASGRSIEELVNHIIEATERGQAPEDTLHDLHHRFGLSAEDAELAVDRVFGGIVRAITEAPENCPNSVKDPVAWESYQMARRDPSIARRVGR